MYTEDNSDNYPPIVSQEEEEAWRLGSRHRDESKLTDKSCYNNPYIGNQELMEAYDRGFERDDA